MRDGEHPLPRSPCIPTQAKGDDHLEDFVKTFSQTSGHLPNRPNPPGTGRRLFLQLTLEHQVSPEVIQRFHSSPSLQPLLSSPELRAPRPSLSFPWALFQIPT